MYIPKHFGIKELVPPEIYNSYKHKGDEFLFQVVFDERLLILIDKIREKYGPMIINDWSWGGGTKYRGFRPPGCNVGADLSQHRFGRAVDMIPNNITPKLMREEILDDQNSEDWKVIGGLEMDISWFHVDVRARTNPDKINLFYP